MRSPLAACPACARHVRVSEVACPFCRSELPESFRALVPLSPAKRLNRAALYALRMGAAAATAAACGGSVNSGDNDAGGTPPHNAQPDGSDDSDTGFTALYGGVAAYGGVAVPDAGAPEPDAAVDASADAGTEERDANFYVLYGGFKGP